MADNKTKIIIETESGNSEQKLKNIAKDLQQISTVGKSTNTAIKQSTSAMTTNFVSLAAKATAAFYAIKKAYSSVREAAQAQEIALYAKSAAESIGLSFERMVNASKRGANGVVDSVTIMKTNLKALKQGFRASEEDFGRLWQIANATGDELGQSVEQTFEQIVNAINTGNSRALIQLGVLPENFKKVSDSADLVTRRAELLKTVFEQLGSSTDRLNKYGDTAYDKFQQLETSISDLKNEISTEFLPVATELVSWLKDAVKYGKDAKDSLKWLITGDVGDSSSLDKGVSGRIVAISNQLEEFKKQRAEIDDKIREANASGDTKGAATLMLERRGTNFNIKNLEKRLKELKNTALDVVHAEQKETKTAQKNTETKERQTKATENYNKIADSLAKQTLTGLNKALGGTEITLSKNVELMYKYGLASAGFGARVDEGAKQAYEAWKKLEDEAEKLSAAFDEMVKNEELLTSIQVSLENISDINFNNLVSAANDIDSITREATKLMVGQSLNYASGAANVADITKSLKITEIPEVAKKGWSAIQGQVIEGFSEAVTSGIINSNLGDALRSAISSIAAGKAQSYGSTLLSGLFGNKGVNVAGALSGFVGSLAVSAIANNWKKWFSDRGKQESIAKNQSTVQSAVNAYFSTYSAMFNPYMTDDLYEDLLDARWAYRTGNLTVSNKGKPRGGLPGLAGYKDYRDTTPSSTYSVIDAINNTVKTVEEYNKYKEKELDLLSAQGKDYQVLGIQVNALKQTMDRVQSYGLITDDWTFWGNMKGTQSHYELDLSDNVQDLKKAYYEALRQYGEETGARNQQKANAFMSLYPYLDDYNIGRYMQFSLSSRKWEKGDINDNASLMHSRIGDVQENLLNRYADPKMLQMIKQAGFEQFNLASMQYTTGDTSKYTEAYLKVLERQKEAAELVMKQQEQIYFDMTKTFEEQAAALETYQQAQDQYYNTKLEILAQERAKEEQIKKEEQQARLRSTEKIESLLGFTGEIARTGNKIYILEGADQVGALRELESQIDDPEALAIIKRLTTYAQNKNKFGKI